jgi:hemerythrin
MMFFRWSDSMSIGMPMFDAEHMQLVSIMNELYESLLSGSAPVILDNVLDGLADYGENHLRHEEAVFAQTRYPHAEWHTKQHDVFRKRIQDLRQATETSSGKALALETLNFLKNWLVSHIDKSDREYATFFAAKGLIGALAPSGPGNVLPSRI